MLSVIDYLAEHPCVDCGEKDYRLLDFDHKERSKKSQNVSTMISKGLSPTRIFSEIAKCDVRCVRCHRLKTIEQMGWYKNVERLQTHMRSP